MNQIEEQKKGFDVSARPDWCPGCGNFGVQVALKRALTVAGKDPDNIVVVSDIGCSSKLPHWINTYGLHSLHGRALPVATGVKLANPSLDVIVSAGDGGTYGIGMGHFIHTLRRNPNLTMLVHNNQVYGLTKGQMTPTSEKGFVSPSSPFGALEDPVNPLTLAMTMGCGFVARGYAGDVLHLAELIMEAMKYEGFALVDIVQPCVTFNKEKSYNYYQGKIHKLTADNHNSADFSAAVEIAGKDDILPIGVIYKR